MFSYFKFILNCITSVNDVTDQNSPNYIEVQERITVFDNDGTFWTKQPIYFKIQFVVN